MVVDPGRRRALPLLPVVLFRRLRRSGAGKGEIVYRCGVGCRMRPFAPRQNDDKVHSKTNPGSGVKRETEKAGAVTHTKTNLVFEMPKVDDASACECSSTGVRLVPQQSGHKRQSVR